ncbi:MAG: metallophosphoesterase [Planctomycetota bacterium]
MRLRNASLDAESGRKSDGPGTVPWDGVEWDFEATTARVVAIGDVQGDLLSLHALLREARLVGDDGNWIGGNAHLVLMGDLVGGHDDARLLVSFVMRLELQARRARGFVHSLLGNHDLLAARGEIPKWTPGEQKLWRDLPPRGAPTADPTDAFRGRGEVARWLARRNAMVRIGDTLFAHAGIDEWFSRTTPGEVNATVRQWITHWQGRGAAPPASTRWAVGVPGMARDSEFACGPLWHRGFKAVSDSRPVGGPSQKHLANWLRAAGVRRLVLGHAPIDDGVILLSHPYYGDLVAMTDTRLADRERGRLRALESSDGRLREIRCADSQREEEVRERQLQLLLADEAIRRSPMRRWWRALRRWIGLDD